ncbi:MAG: recombinase family protein, partial [Pseudomonadota bacterium]
EDIERRGIHFISLTERFDTSHPMGRAMLQVALVFAELERAMISERTKAGIAAAKAAGKRFGRAHTIRDSKRRMNLLRKMDQEGKLRDEQGELRMSAQALMERLNKADTQAARIVNAETVRRWKREGFPGVDADIEEIPLAEETDDDPKEP